ncbi:hypothetical protein G6F42_021271 [Rhizopus arrhizus]|nr:hypothetical protein G6F42_021271 [Rhizopus arrhizus]
MALCYINRVTKLDDEGHIKPRILVLSVSPDSAYQYIPLMNCIFSAQKASIPLDVCKIFGEETAFLQQASNITGGVYVKMENRLALLEYLMMAFLPDRYSRNYLNLPSQDQVDFRAACFCHKKIVDIGFVCSFSANGLLSAPLARPNLPLDQWHHLPPLQIHRVN